MGTKYRVFISHSAHHDEEPTTQQFLDRLIATLSGNETTELLVDQRHLQAGDEWCQQLYGWMGLCNAAVVLLSPRAIRRENSTWVPREVNLLMWRKALDPDFIVIPVLVGGLRRSEITENPFVADSRLNDINFAQGATEEQQINAIATKVLEKTDQHSHRTAFDPIQISVEDSIRRYAPGQALHQALSQHYGDDLWQPFTDVHRSLAVKMVRHSVSPEVDQVIGDVSIGSQPDYFLAARLFEVLFPMRLPAEPSCRLLTLCNVQGAHRAIIVNCRDTWIIRMMLRAATGELEAELLKSWRILEIPDGWGDQDELEITRFLAAEIAEAILGTGGWELMCEDPNPMESLNFHLDELKQDCGTTVLVCAPYSPRWLELISPLHNRFPRLVFLLWSGPTLPDLPSTPRDASDLEPLSLPEASDRQHYLRYRTKQQLFGILS